MPGHPRAVGLAPILLLTLLATLAVGCGGDGGQQANSPPEPVAELDALSGVWQLSTRITSNTCGLGDGTTDTEPLTLIQHESDVSVVSQGGLWGGGAVRGNTFEFTGTAVEIGENGCRSTQRATGSVSGVPNRLDGSLTVTVSHDPESCGSEADCTISQDAGLVLSEPYRTGCINRDAFGPPTESDYVLPFPVGKAYRVSNSYCWPAGGHREQLAYDFAMPIGDPVVASRAGVVRVVKDDSPDDGQGSAHNHVMVEHEDGTVGFYAHLQQRSALVRSGDTVQAGEAIANNGHSGTDDIPHLHFGVYARYPPAEGADHAVNFSNTNGRLDCRGGLVMGETYRALAH